MIEKWYRGHQGDKNAFDNFGIIWLSDDPDYAQLYADEYSDGVVSTFYIDMDKVNELDWYDDEDFDPYDPDMSLVKEYMEEQGGNAYRFGLGDGTTVLALLSEEPIVNVERYINENKKHKFMSKIMITENKLNEIISESVNNVLNEDAFAKERVISNTHNVFNNIEVGINMLKQNYFENLSLRECNDILEGSKMFFNLLYYMLKRQKAIQKRL